jgi:hypothetical protein
MLARTAPVWGSTWKTLLLTGGSAVSAVLNEFAAQTEPSPVAMPHGSSPTVAVQTMRLVDGLMREIVPPRFDSLVTQTPPIPAVMQRGIAIGIRFATRFVAGLMRKIAPG